MDAQYQDIPYKPVKGTNSTDAPDMLQDGQVAASQNFLFEDGLFKTRPGYGTSMTFSGVLFAFAKGFRGPGFNLLISNVGAIIKSVLMLPGTITNTSITGAATTFGVPAEMNAAAVNGVILIGNNSGGLIRWDYSGTTYTILASAPYKYVTGHLSRAVAAFQMSGGAALTNPITFAWSKPGDETTWNTGGGIDGSGSAILNDSPDQITGLGVVNNVVVIPRTTGFHLAFPTGVAIPNAYRIETWSRDDGIGCPYPGTFCTTDNLCFFVGTDDVYTFDTNVMTRIGHPIRNQLFADLSNVGQSSTLGFITRTTVVNAQGSPTVIPKLRYHIVVGVPNAGVGAHYCYSIEDGTWSRHIYGTAVTPFFRSVGQLNVNSAVMELGFTSLFSNGGTVTVEIWDQAVPPDTASSLTGPVHVVGKPEQDTTLQRVLVSAYEQTGGTQPIVTASVSTQLGEKTNTRSATATWNQTNNPIPVRKWIDLRGGQPTVVGANPNPDATGQNFQLTLSLPGGEKFVGNYYNLRFDPQGSDYRG